MFERFNKGEIDADTSSKIEKQILEDEFDDEEFLNFAHSFLYSSFQFILFYGNKSYLSITAKPVIIFSLSLCLVSLINDSINR